LTITCRSRNLLWLNSWISFLVKWRFGFRTGGQGNLYLATFYILWKLIVKHCFCFVMLVFVVIIMSCVWFWNVIFRTKLKQTEVDCEYLKRCCETLTEENRRLQKELQELRALKSSPPFYMQLPATTLTMCPSCERVATNSTTNQTSSTINSNASQIPVELSLSKPRILPFPNGQAQATQAQAQAQAQAHRIASSWSSISEHFFGWFLHMTYIYIYK